MQLFKTRNFANWAKKQGVSDRALVKVLAEIENGLVETNYGAGLFKKRIATKGRGKSASVRTLLAYKHEKICIFLYGFEKNERDNIEQNEEKAFKLLAKSLLDMSKTEITERVKSGAISEIDYEKE